MSRNLDSVLFKIRYIVTTLCRDEILQSKWNHEIRQFDSFDRSTHIFYYNVAPEELEQIRWIRVSNILNVCIPDKNPVHDWEKRIVNIFLAKDHGDDLPDITDVYTIPINDANYYDYYPDYESSDYEEYKDEERALSRHEARSY